MLQIPPSAPITASTSCLRWFFVFWRGCGHQCARHLRGRTHRAYQKRDPWSGADIVCECVGRPEAFPEGLRYLRKAGMYLEPGNFVECGEAPQIGVHEICANNLRIIGMTNHITDYQTVMQIMLRSRDRFPWEKLFSHHFSIDDYETAIQTSMTDNSMKVIIDPWM